MSNGIRTMNNTQDSDKTSDKTLLFYPNRKNSTRSLDLTNSKTCLTNTEQRSN
ncbi:hypothetical protein HanPI659440_Chr02g0041181 [Helianthus annuus]|nr:hypothetical protein HanPI659440_Chr02g0041181 [Helianthus annuus]